MNIPFMTGTSFHILEEGKESKAKEILSKNKSKFLNDYIRLCEKYGIFINIFLQGDAIGIETILGNEDYYNFRKEDLFK